MRDVVSMNACAIADIAATIVCLAVLVISWRLQRSAERQVTEARQILAEARLLLDREAHPLRVVDGGKP